MTLHVNLDNWKSLLQKQKRSKWSRVKNRILMLMRLRLVTSGCMDGQRSKNNSWALHHDEVVERRTVKKLRNKPATVVLVATTACFSFHNRFLCTEIFQACVCRVKHDETSLVTISSLAASVTFHFNQGTNRHRVLDLNPTPHLRICIESFKDVMNGMCCLSLARKFYVKDLRSKELRHALTRSYI